MDSGLRLPPWRLEVFSGLPREFVDHREPLLSSRNGESDAYSPLIDTRPNIEAAQNLYNNISYIYPDSDIWIIGHSLGGALGSLLGATFGVPVVTFESPGDRMASQRLHLPSPVSLVPSQHVLTELTDVFTAFYPPHYSRVPHRGSCTNGDMYRRSLFVFPRRLCFGSSMPPRKNDCIRYCVEPIVEGRSPIPPYFEYD